MVRSNGAVARRPETEILGTDSSEMLDYRGNASALEAITRAEIDIQISTAKRFPRSPEKFLREAVSMVSVSPELAAQCSYCLPARKGEGGKGGPISGPSVRLAEIIASCWGNLRVVGRIVEDDGQSVTAQGVCLDLERNVGYSVEARRGVSRRDGSRYSNDMVNVTCNAAIAIATRNATFKAVPRAYVNVVEEEAKAIARGDVKTLPERADRALGWFAGKGVKEEEIFKALGLVGRADMTLDHLMTLQGYKTAVSEGHATVEEIFRPAPEPTSQTTRQPGESKSDALTRALAGEPAPKAEEAR